MMSDGFNMGFGGGFMWLVWILLIIAILWVLAMISGSKSDPSKGQKTALEILEERYAKGEINQQEFLKKKKDLDES